MFPDHTCHKKCCYGSIFCVSVIPKRRHVKNANDGRYFVFMCTSAAAPFLNFMHPIVRLVVSLVADLVYNSNTHCAFHCEICY